MSLVIPIDETNEFSMQNSTILCICLLTESESLPLMIIFILSSDYFQQFFIVCMFVKLPSSASAECANMNYYANTICAANTNYAANVICAACEQEPASGDQFQLSEQ